MSHIYREDGGKLRVNVISDETDVDGMRKVKLRCIETLRAAPLFPAVPAGEVFEVSCKQGWEYAVGWTLEAEQ